MDYIAQHATRDVFAFVPLQNVTIHSSIDMPRPLLGIDRQLDDKYPLIPSGPEFIESMIKLME